MKYESFNPCETEKIAYNLAIKAKAGQIFCLAGDLGAGKTVFSKGFAKGLGVSDIVTSPTFTILNIYEGTLPFYHFDVYRISDVDEMYDTGFEEYFYGNGICLVEWAELIKDILPSDVIWITITNDLTKDFSYRLIEVSEGI